MLPPGLYALFRAAYAVMAGLYTLLAVAGLGAVWLALSDGDVLATLAFICLTVVSFAIVGGALDGLRETGSHR
ncbi:MAG TPA: hypothetical protein VIO14_12715 [Dehalococcoidia bacterium]